MLFAVSALPKFDKVLLMGQGLLILCALIWAFFTVSVRQSGLKPLQVSALVVVPNAMIVIAWFLATTPEIELFNLSFAALLSQLIVQGLFVGIFSGWFYAKAISKLGAEKTSAIGAFTPIVASIAAFTILQEALEFLPLLGLCFTTVGVLIASRQS
jgi:drug/metabolite transporter (DMT)-like permease